MTERSTKKQQQLLEFIDQFIKEHGYGPSYREIMRGLDYKSVSTVAVHVGGLLNKGYIRKRDNSARSIEIASLRHGSGVQEPVPSKTHEQWLKGEVESRLAGEEPKHQEADVLIKAAEILGFSDFEDLKRDE